jgi:hypothetical protein
LAALTSLSLTATRNAARRGEFEAVRYGKRLLVPAAAARLWLAHVTSNSARMTQRPDLERTAS